MSTGTSPLGSTAWLSENGPKELDLLSRSIAFNPSIVPGSLTQVQASYGTCLLDGHGFILTWYPGAEALYGYSAVEAVGRHISFLYAGLDDGDTAQKAAARRLAFNDELIGAAKGHVIIERSQWKKDGSSFWANFIAAGLLDDSGCMRGYASVTRDFSDFHEIEKQAKRSNVSPKLKPHESSVASVVSGEFEKVCEANDAFLSLVGYSRDELAAGVIDWAALTPQEFAPLDRFAHEEELKFGACTPYEKQLVRKDGTRVWVTIATALIRLFPFRWITFVQDLRLSELQSSDTAESDQSSESESKNHFDEMVGTSSALKRVLRQIEVVAPTDATVLVMGETGTGKELVARAIHRMSPRRGFPCISLNCAAIPTGLLESELFGYERGAFTGALTQKIGRFEMAHRGTFFLDEVGDIPIELQPKLLRALQEKSFERLGSTKTIAIDVRLVAATNRNLQQMMGDKLFRSDLYYRLKVFPIIVPPLRDRPEDIPALVRHFTNKYALRMNRKIDNIPSHTMQALTSWSWPGNIRELENFIERAVILSSGTTLRAPLNEIEPHAPALETGVTLEQVERDHILRIFRETGGVVTTTATLLGLHRTTLNAMMRKLGISRRDL